MDRRHLDMRFKTDRDRPKIVQRLPISRGEKEHRFFILM